MKLRFGKFAADKKANRMGQMFKVLSNSGPKGIEKAQRMYKQLSGGRNVPDVDFRPNHFRDVLINQNKGNIPATGNVSAWHFMDAPANHARHLASGRGLLGDIQYNRVHSPEVQKAYQYAKSNPEISRFIPLPKNKPITLETGSPRRGFPETETTVQRGIFRRTDGAEHNVPAPGEMRTMLVAKNQPTQQTLPLIPHELPHTGTRVRARLASVEEPDIGTHLLGLNKSVKVTHHQDDLPLFNRLQNRAAELDANAKAYKYAPEWGKAKIPGITRKSVQDAAAKSMLDKDTGYFGAEQLNILSAQIQRDRISKVEANQLTKIFTDLLQQYPHLPIQDRIAVNKLLKMIEQAKKRTMFT